MIPSNLVSRGGPLGFRCQFILSEIAFSMFSYSDRREYHVCVERQYLPFLHRYLLAPQIDNEENVPCCKILFIIADILKDNSKSLHASSCHPRSPSHMPTGESARHTIFAHINLRSRPLRSSFGDWHPRRCVCTSF